MVFTQNWRKIPMLILIILNETIKGENQEGAFSVSPTRVFWLYGNMERPAWRITPYKMVSLKLRLHTLVPL
jgi:hypothetical protein